MAKKDWDPENTYVLVLGLGLDEWADEDDPSWRRHASVARVFRKAGVPDEQVLFWEDRDGEPERMRKQLPKFLADTDEDSTFFFYYAGHGALDEESEDDFYFCHPTVEDDAIYGYELFDMIEEHFWGTQAIIWADCCYSGSLVEIALERDGDVSYGALTSATSDVESTGNWTFTDCLLAGLRGSSHVDGDEDGTIEFQELCDYVLETMEAEEDQPASYGETDDFDASFRLAIVRS